MGPSHLLRLVPIHMGPVHLQMGPVHLHMGLANLHMELEYSVEQINRATTIAATQDLRLVGSSTQILKIGYYTENNDIYKNKQLYCIALVKTSSCIALPW